MVADLIPRFTEGEVLAAVRRIARRLDEDYRGRDPLLVGILNGSFVFLADLIRAMTVPAQVDFIRARSYGKGTRSTGAVEITKDIETDVTERHVVVVEDILDTGETLRFVTARIAAGEPASIRTCALLLREGSTPPDYHGLVVPPGFVVGYGIDYAEQHRGLRDIRAVPGT